MKLNLKKPLIVFDLETTGLDTCKDRIIEIAYLKINPDGKETAHKFRVNPEMHIPESSTEIHGITDDDVRNCPTFRQKAKEIANDFIGTDIAGYNSNHFDIPILSEEFSRAGINPDFIERAEKIDVQTIYHKKEPRTLEAAYRYYCNREHTNAHAALGDVQATYEVLQAQLDKYQDLKNDIHFLAEFTAPAVRRVDPAGRMVYDNDGEPLFNFGKFKGQKVKDVLSSNQGYYDWIINSDFPEQTKAALTKIKLSMR